MYSVIVITSEVTLNVENQILCKVAGVFIPVTQNKSMETTNLSNLYTYNV